MNSEVWESHAKLIGEELNEKPRRLVAGLLSEVIGWGGTKPIAKATELDPKTIRPGRLDLQHGLESCPKGRVRREGGGRPTLKKKTR